MGSVFLEMTISLDGFVAAPNIDITHPLGDGGERLHTWMMNPTNEIDRQVAASFFAGTGAFLIGRRTFDLGERPWGNDGTFGMPCFVITHRPREVLVKGPTTFTFVTDGLMSALEQAKAAAGDKDVCIMGGAELAQHYLKAGVVEEIRIHIVPVLIGAGTRLFENIGTEQIELERTNLIQTPYATHMTFRVINKESTL